MYNVLTPNGFSFLCVEFEDAVVLADELSGDSADTAYVVDEDNLEVVYTAGNHRVTGN